MTRDEDDPERMGNAFHEAGHVVVGFLAGGTVLGASIQPQSEESVGETAGHAQIVNFPAVEPNVLMHLAGPLAEVRFRASCTGPADFQFDVGTKVNWTLPALQRHVREALLVPHDPQTGAEFVEAFSLLQWAKALQQDRAQEEFEALLNQVKTTLNQSQYWDAVTALARKLYELTELDGAAIREILFANGLQEGPGQ